MKISKSFNILKEKNKLDKNVKENEKKEKTRKEKKKFLTDRRR